jgi:hypothetical protein
LSDKQQVWRELVLVVKAELGSMSDTNGSILKAMLRAGLSPSDIMDAIRGLGILIRAGQLGQASWPSEGNQLDLRYLWSEKARQGLPLYTRCLTAYYDSQKCPAKPSDAKGPVHIGSVIARMVKGAE